MTFVDPAMPWIREAAQIIFNAICQGLGTYIALRHIADKIDKNSDKMRSRINKLFGKKEEMVNDTVCPVCKRPVDGHPKKFFEYKPGMKVELLDRCDP